jgi:superfamily II DNA or RNA helicase
MVLTEGWDSPATSCAIIARPTQSAALYTQMVGRILRPFPGKDDALVLDVVGVTGRHRLRSLTDLSKVEVRDGETLVEAQERVATEQRDRMEKVRIEGTRKSREVELFSASHAVWLKTYAGIDFIPVRDGLIVLWGDEDGTYRVGVKNKGRKGEWVLRGIDFEYALAWGEQIANERDATVADKNRAWRRAKPSQAQLDLALKLFPAKVDEIVNMRKGALSDRISIHFASRELDPRR